ncbi:hypothetical protein A0O34_13350 [Chryseobacterium glaciei]|uniref:Uncharacterized protein n=1 Tax=Chryseobacterium glaciei TaxID=1685010 RepID=A0A172XX57_9FLAO|nr:hypothetical protein [Chryseobacterium glaciei]ANF51432.1 hypothetical protein A0O34_13350 [Chryseobacterium glaciei]
MEKNMKEIICPYSWDCGRIFDPQDLSKFDYNFIQSAVEKKMTFMIIHCPNCSREFKFDAVQWKADEFGYSNPNNVVKKNEKTTKQLAAILNKAKVEIPLPYFKYLISNKFEPQISIFPEEEDFTLFTLSQLCEKINVDGKSYLTINQLKGFTFSLLEIVGESSQKSQEINYKELSDCLAIGSENTRILFIDNRDQNSLWVFHPDGGDIEKTAVTLENIISREK